MKKTFFLFLLAAAVFVGCKSNPKDLLVNKWKVTDMSMPGQAMTEDVKSAMSQGTMEFTKDGKMTITGMGTGNDQSGTYTLSEDGKTLSVVTNGKTDVNSVAELSKTKLSIKNNTTGGTLTAVPK